MTVTKEMKKFAEEFWDDIPKHKKESEALNFIYDRIDKCFKAGRFDIVDAILFVGLPYINFSTVIKLALLTTTGCAKDKLQNRKSYYDMCKSHFLSREETQDCVEGLLIGLE